MQLLPIGIQSFYDIRRNNFIYVDKTQKIHALASNPKWAYFLARPRRFGKSLLLSTLSALFQGQRDLFAGLWIEQEGRWDWQQQHPIIHLDMTEIPRTTPQEFRQGLIVWMHEVIKQHQLENSVQMDQSPAGLLRDTIAARGRQHTRDSQSDSAVVR